MEQKIWWYELNNEQRGPIGQNELDMLINQGFLNGENFVWKEGLVDWKRIADLNSNPHLTGSNSNISKTSRNSYPPTESHFTADVSIDKSASGQATPISDRAFWTRVIVGILVIYFVIAFVLRMIHDYTGGSPADTTWGSRDRTRPTILQLGRAEGGIKDRVKYQLIYAKSENRRLLEKSGTYKVEKKIVTCYFDDGTTYRLEYLKRHGEWILVDEDGREFIVRAR